VIVSKLFQVHGLAGVASAEIDGEGAASVGRFHQIGSGQAIGIKQAAGFSVARLLNGCGDAGNIRRAGEVMYGKCDPWLAGWHRKWIQSRNPAYSGS